MEYASITRRELFDVWRAEVNLSMRETRVREYILNKYDAENVDAHLKKYICELSSQFCKRIKMRWTASHFVLAQFVRKHSDWLNSEIQFNTVEKIQGRPRKLFSECSLKSKKRKVQPLLEQNKIWYLLFQF